MADIEKVMKGLEHCLSRYVDGLCDDCPYMGAIDKTYMIPMKCKEIIMRDALELLKEKQPKKGEWDIDEYGIHHCPFCKAINETVYQNFCPNCGADMRMDGEKE